MASDTRMCKYELDGTLVVMRDDVQKTIQLDEHTFAFMSGVYDAVRYAMNAYRVNRSGVIPHDRQLLTNILRAVYNAVPAESKTDGTEVAVIYIVRLIGNEFFGELYLHSYNNYKPLLSQYVPGGVCVLGSYISGTDDYIRESILAAKTDKAMISAFREMYNEQCRAEVGGTLELFKVSPISGLTQKMDFEIVEAKKNV